MSFEVPGSLVTVVSGGFGVSLLVPASWSGHAHGVKMPSAVQVWMAVLPSAQAQTTCSFWMQESELPQLENKNAPTEMMIAKIFIKNPKLPQMRLNHTLMACWGRMFLLRSHSKMLVSR